MQVCCALEVGALFLKILQRIAVIAILFRRSHPYWIAKLQINTSHLLGRYSQTIYYQPSTPGNHTYIPEENQSFGTWVWRVISGKHYRTTKIGKTDFPSKNAAMRRYRYPIHFVKNDLVNIVISTSYRLLTCANRTTARRFWFRQSATKWVETLRPKWTFWRFPDSTILSPIVEYKM